MTLFEILLLMIICPPIIEGLKLIDRGAAKVVTILMLFVYLVAIGELFFWRAALVENML